jgi:aldehyde:ferredoxin oxidoreductase
LSHEALLSLGPRLGILDWDRVQDLAGLALFAGLDPGGVGALAAWLAECRMEGILTPRESGGPIAFGDVDSVAECIRSAATRVGAGRFLGEGTHRAGARFGEEAESRLVRWAGVDWPSADPRLMPGAALTFLATPHDVDPFLYVQLRDRGGLGEHYLEDVDDLMAMTERRRERKAVADSFGICSLPFSALPVWRTREVFSMLHALTGVDPESLSGIGKRVLALEAILRGPEVGGISPIPLRFRETGRGWEERDLDGWDDLARRVAEMTKGTAT